MNSLIDAYRARFQDDRPDEDILIEFGRKSPELIQQYPDAAKQLDGIWASRDKAFQDSLAEATTPSLGGEFVRGVKRGTDSLQGTLYNAGALASAGLGKIGLPTDNLTKTLILKGQEQEAEAAENAPTVAGWENADTFEKKFRYMVGGAGEVLPSLAEAGAVAAIGAVAGSAAGSAAPGPGNVAGGVAGGVLGLIEKQAVKSLVKNGITQLTEGYAAKLAKETAALSAKYAGNLATAVNSYSLSAGEIYGDLINEPGVDPDKAFNTALGAGTIAGAADTVLPSFVVGRFFKGVASETEKKAAHGYLLRLVADAAKTVPMEAGTEGFQELVGIAAKRYAKGEEPVFGGLSAAERNRVINASILGALGGAIAAPVAAIETQSPGSSEQPQEARTKTPPSPTPAPGQPEGAAPPVEAASGEIDPALNFRVTDEEKLASIESRLASSAALFGPLAGRAPTAEEMSLLKLRESLGGEAAPVVPAAPVVEPVAPTPTTPEIPNQSAPLGSTLAGTIDVGGKTMDVRYTPRDETDQSDAVYAPDFETFNQRTNQLLDEQGVPRNSYSENDRRRIYEHLQEGQVAGSEIQAALEAADGREALVEMGLVEPLVPPMDKLRRASAAARSRLQAEESQVTTPPSPVQQARAASVTPAEAPVLSDEMAARLEQIRAQAAAQAAQVVPVVPPVAPAQAEAPAPVARPDLTNLLAFDDAQLRHGEAGLGKKNSPAYLPTESKDDLYQDSRAEASDKNSTRKLGVFQRGDEVFAGSAYKNRGDRISTPQGNTTYEKLMADGWKLVASLKLTDPAKNFAVTYSPTEWNALSETLRSMGQAAQRTYAAVSAALPGVVGPEAVQDSGDGEATIGNIPTGNEAAEEELAQDAGTTDLVPAQEGRTSSRPDIGPTDEGIARLSKLVGVGEDFAGIIYDEFGGGAMSVEDAADMLNALIEEDSGKPRLAAMALVFRIERKYGSKDTAEIIQRAAEALSGAAGEGIDRSSFEASLVQASKGTDPSQGPAADTGAGAARTDGSGGSEGTDAGAQPGGEGQGVTKFRGQSTPAARRIAASRYAATVDHLRTAGYDVGFIEGKLAEMGSYEAGVIRTALADAANPTAAEFITLLHEGSGHGVFENESPERQRMLIEAVASMSNDTLGLGKDFNPRLDQKLQGTAREDVFQEERLVESMALHLERSGFDPVESRGLAQALWRWVKDVYLRGLLLLQESFTWRQPDGALALRYFENRARALASGDAAYSFTSWLGGPKLNRAAQAERISHADGAGTMPAVLDPISGEMSYAEAEPDTVAGMEWNAAVRYRGVSTINAETEVTKDVNIDARSGSQRDVAAENMRENVLRGMYDEWTATGHNPSGLTFEDFLRSGNFVGLPELPAATIAAHNAKLVEANQQPVDPATTIAMLPSEAQQQRAGLIALRSAQRTWGKMVDRFTEAKEQAKSKQDALDRANDKLHDLTTKYTDADLMLNTALYGLPKTPTSPGELGVLDHLKQAVADNRQVKNAAHKVGMLTQIIRETEGVMAKPAQQQYETAINKLYVKLSKESQSGTKFFDAMQAAVEVEDIDWQADKAAVIKARLADAALTEPALEVLLQDDVDSKALFSVLVAFGRSNDYFMGLLALRRSKAGVDRALVNTALQLAMEDHKDAIKEARGMVRSLPTLGKRADRLIRSIERLKDERTAKLDDIARDKSFLAFHAVGEPIIREAMARLEAGVGAMQADWESSNHATYWVPTSPDFKLTRDKDGKIAVTGGDEKTLRFNENGSTTPEVRGHLASIKRWLDAVPSERQGSDWLTLKTIYDKLGLVEGSFKHDTVKRSAIVNVIGSLVNRLEYIGTPLARNAAHRMRRQISLDGPKVTNEASVFGQKWSAEETRAKKALGKLNQDTFRRLFHNGFWKFSESRPDITAAGPDPWVQFDAMLTAWKRHIEAEPATRAMLAKPGAWLALKKYYTAGAKANEFLYGFNKSLGLKVEDGGMFRALVGHPTSTVMRGFSAELGRAHLAMLETGWLDHEIGGQKSADDFNTDPDNLRLEMAKQFTPDVLRKFVDPMAKRTGTSLFNAPAMPSGTMALASRANVVAAFEAAGGDMVKFAEELYAREGGTGDIGEFVGETLGTFQAYFNSIHTQMTAKAHSGDSGMPPVPHREMMDARLSEDYPAEFLSYYTFDEHSLRQTVRRMSFQAAYGRDMAGMRSDLEQAEQEQNRLADHYREIVRDAMATGKKGRALKAEIAGMAKAADIDLLRLEQAEDNEKSLRSAQEQFTALVKAQSGLPLEMRWWMEAIRTMAALTVQGPATALTDTVSLIEQPLRKTGFSGATGRMVVAEGGSLARSSFGSLLQLIGVQLHADASWLKLRQAIEGADPDAVVAKRDKLAAILNDETVGGLTKAMRAIRLLPSTGVSGLKGDLGFDTLKPLGAFTQISKWGHLAATWGIYQNVERLTKAGMDHFQSASGAADLADPAFQFTGKMLGWRSVQAWTYYREALARQGMSVEGLARAAMARGTGELLTSDQMLGLSAMATSEITLESNSATRPPGFITNPVLALAAPLISWAISKSADSAKGFREADGTTSGLYNWRGIKRGLLPYAAIVPLGLAYAWMRDEWDEEVTGKKANVTGYGGSLNPWLVTLDRLGRVGTFGVFGDAANAALNSDTNRDFSVDSRVFFVSSMLSAMKSVGTAIRQEQVDYAGVVRPLAQALGGSGYLQYADTVNNALSLAGVKMDNVESRVVARMNVNNYLRAAGKMLKMDVRTGKGMASIPNPIKPYVGQMVLAAYANDAAGFREAHRSAVREAREEKKADPEKSVLQSFTAYHPLNTVFRVRPTEDELSRALRLMSQDGRAAVSTAIRLFNGYGEQLLPPGNKSTAFNMGKVEKAPALRTFNPDRVREARVAAGY